MIGVVMAGGHGSRMRASGESTPKPLVRVGGLSLLVRAVCALVRHGFTEIVVCASGSPPVIEHAEGAARLVVEAAGGRLDVLVESTPLGNIGAVGALRERADDILVVFADNLTTLDLAVVAGRHRDRRAAMTLATHLEPFPIPYGRINTEGDRVLAYDEKPVLALEVASAVTVLSPAAVAAVSADGPTGLVDLCRTLLARDALVVAVRHSAAWVDVNDTSAIERATQLLHRHSGELERWWPDPPVREHLIALRGEEVLYPRDAPDRRPEWAVEGALVPIGDIRASAPIEIDDFDRAGPARFRVSALHHPPGAAPDGWYWAPPRNSLAQRLVAALAPTMPGAPAAE